MITTGRNAPCPCGSGKKFKKCCLAASSHGTLVTPLATCPQHRWPIDDVLERYFDHMAARRYDDAEATARELLRRFPDRIDGDERLGELYEARRDPLRAAEHFRLAAERMIPGVPDYDPAYVPFLLYRADKLERAARGVTPTDLVERSESIAGDIIRGDLADVSVGILDLQMRYPDHYTIDERCGQLAEVLRNFCAAARHFRIAAERAAAQGAPEWHVGYLRRRAAVLDRSSARPAQSQSHEA